MLWIILFIISSILISLNIFAARNISLELKDSKKTRMEIENASTLRKGLLVSSFLLFLFMFVYTLFACTAQIPSGSIGIVYRFGEIVDQKPEGIAFTFPWEKVRTESVQVQAAKYENISAFSSETQDVFVTATLNYSVNVTAVQELLREVGPDWKSRIIDPRIQNFFKEETVKYRSVDIAPNREKIRSAVEAALASDLNRFSINVDDLLIENISFTPEFTAAIEAKQIASQEALREQENVEKARAQAEQGIATAEGAAREIIIAAEAQEESNQLIAGSLTPELLQYLAIQRLSDNVTIALIPSGEGVIIDPTTLLTPNP